MVILLFVMMQIITIPRNARPIKVITPGALNPNVTQQVACSTKWGTDARGVTSKMRQDVFRAYKIPLTKQKLYVIDHLDARENGGADVVANLWPELKAGVWSQVRKNRLENTTHRLLCSGKLTIADIARDTETDWIAAYQKYVH